MTYEIKFTRAAEKQLEGIARPYLRKIAERIDKLASNPFPPGCEKLKGADGDVYRIRQGDYRVLYSVFEKEVLVLILKIAHRREVYRG